MRQAVTFLLFFVFSIVMQFENACAQISQSDLRAFTEHAAAQGDVTLQRPQIFWNPDSVEYTFGDTIPSGNDPLDVPLNAQFTVTAIRLYRNTARQRRFWTPVLQRAEREIADMLSLINDRELHGRRLHDALQERKVRIATIYREELDQVAKEHGKQGATEVFPASLWSVDVLTKPEGGVISYLPAGRWNLYLFMVHRRNRHDFPKPEWITIRQSQGVNLVGKYWFHIRWPGEIEHKELVDITNSQPIVFTQHHN